MKRTKLTYRSAWKRSVAYLREIRLFIFLGVFLFVLSGVTSFVFPSHFTFFNDTLKQLGQEVEGLGPTQLILFIFSNNVSSAFFALIFGTALGIMPMFNALLNGALVGYVLALSTKLEGFGVIWRLVPHGIFELPAIFISIGMGIYLGMFVFENGKKKAFLYRLRESLNVFAIIVIPLLVIAAIIEGLLIAFAG